MIGGVLGKLASLIPGVAEGFQKLTDLLGITNSAEEQRLAKLKASTAALDKFASKTLAAAQGQIAILNQLGAESGKTAKQQKILADAIAAILAKERGRTVQDRLTEPRSLESAGLDVFIEQFKEAARTSTTGKTSDILLNNPNLKKAFDDLEALANIGGLQNKFKQLVSTLDFVANNTKASGVEFLNFNQTVTGLNLSLGVATGKAVSAIDLLGDTIGVDLQKELKKQQEIFSLRIQIEQKIIDKLNQIVDSEEKIAKERAAMIGNVRIVQGASGS